MQTTLLGLAIAVILALVAALVGPHFVDWNQYRGEFEARASSITGLSVRIAGPVEARLLPTPALTLQRIEVMRPGDAGVLRVRSLSLEFSLGALVRGEWRATIARLEGAEITAGLDSAGRLDWPVPSIAVDPDTVSIERLDIVDSRAVLADAVSGSRLILDKLEFKGELRSFAGPVKGEGSFVVGGLHYPYRIAASRAGEDGGVRVRLNIDPIDRPLIADVDAFVFIERGVPRFEGSLQLARPVGRAPDGIIEPWRVTTHIKGDSTAAVLEQIEFQYGPDDRAIKLRGDANLALGGAPQLTIVLTAAQVDLDRVLALPEAVRRRPLLAIKFVAESFAGAPRLPLPVTLGISVENVALAGTMLQRVSGEIKADADSWDIEVLEFRAPGSTQVRLSGRLDVGPKGLAFSGPAKVEARDARALVAWLTDRADVQSFAAGVLRVEGDMRFGSETIAIDRLKADLDRTTVEGRFAYSWASGERPARIEAALNAPDIDLDRGYALAQSVFGDTAFEWPREGVLSLKVGRASVAGVEVKGADVAVRFDRQGLEIERFALGDLGGAALAVKGRIDTRASSPNGTVTLDLDARALDGVATLLEKFAPVKAAEFRRRAGRFVPAKVRATLAVNAEPARPAGSPVIAAFKLEGSAGTFRINLQGKADGTGDAFALANLSRLGTTKMSLTGALEASDGSALIELVGLDQLVAVDKRPGRLALTASGAFDGEMTVDGQLVAGGLDVATKGTVRLLDGQGPTAGLTIKVGNANIRSPRPAAAGRAAETLSAALTGRLSLAEGVVALSDVAGNLAGTDIGGRLKIGLAPTSTSGPALASGTALTVDGDIELGELNLPAAIAAAIGMPSGSAATATLWPSDPFEQGLLGRLSGRIAVKSVHASLTPKLAAKNIRSVVHFDQSELAFDEIDGTLAGGRVAGDIAFARGPDGVTARTHLKFAGADLAELIRGGPPPLAGRLTFNVDLEGTGRSPIALIGSLGGGGTFTLQDGRILRLDPAAFDAVIRSVDQGLPIDAPRIRDRMEQALGNGGLSIPLAEGEIVVAAGHARLNNIMVRTQGAELALVGSMMLAEDAIDARMTLSGPGRPDGPGALRPEIGIALKGPVDAPRRTLDVATFTNWLALRAVEQQTKRIDALESGRDTPANVPTPVPAPKPPATSAPATTPPRPRSATSAQPSSPTAKPAPLDIRPPAAPRVENNGGRTSAPPRQAQPPAARSNSWFGGSAEP